jgi:hypothetical protein
LIPHHYETAVESVKLTGKITIESIALNPELGDWLFEKPE